MGKAGMCRVMVMSSGFCDVISQGHSAVKLKV